MMDRREKKSLSDEEDMTENKKFCADCKTTKTPLWRGGPAGPKSLCNACGIRYRKKRRGGMVCLEKSNMNKKKERSNSMTTTSTSNADTTSNSIGTVGSGNGLSESLKKKLMVLGKEVMWQRSQPVKKQRCQRRRKLREEEQAAFSLMALSCGSVFA